MREICTATWKWSHCTFYLLNTWIYSQLRGKSKIMMYTFTLNPLLMHHFNLLLKADGQSYKKIWNTKALKAGKLSLLTFQACCCSEALQHFIYRLKLQGVTITFQKSKNSSIQQRAAPCLYLFVVFNTLLYVLMVHYHLLNYRICWFFFSSHPQKWI